MKKIILPALFVLLLFPLKGLCQTAGLPPGAVVIERRPVPSKAHPARELLLWMINPKKHPREAPQDPYTCPEETRGHYYSGPTRVSLVETKTGRIINTIAIIEDGNSFDIPYKIHNGYYRVEGVPEGQEGKPVIMWLKDYNGDGRAQEFALFDAQACMGLATTLIGYSESKDKVIQYSLGFQLIEGAKRSLLITLWPDYLFSKKPVRPGYWKYEIDYRGRGGTLDRWEIRYLPRYESFEGKLTRIRGD